MYMERYVCTSCMSDVGNSLSDGLCTICGSTENDDLIFIAVRRADNGTDWIDRKGQVYTGRKDNTWILFAVGAVICVVVAIIIAAS